MAESINEALRLKMDDAKIAVAQSQLQIMKEFKANVETQLDSGFTEVIKSNNQKFEFKDLQKNVGNIFKSNAKTFTKATSSFGSKIASIPGKIGTAFSKFNPLKGITNLFSSGFDKIKEGFSKLNPFSKIGSGIKKTKDKIKKVVGRDTETLKAKYYENWWSPEKVAIRQQKALQKFWKKQLKKEEKKARKEGRPSITDPAITTGQLLGTIAKAVTKIAKAIAFFFNGPGLGIALAIGLTPPVLLICAALLGVAYLICDTLKTIIPPIIDIFKGFVDWIMNVFAEPVTRGLNSIAGAIEAVFGIYTKIYNIVGSILDKILSFLDSPISTITEGVSSAVNGITSAVSDLFTDDGKVHEGQDLNTMFFRMYQEWTTDFLTPMRDGIVKMTEDGSNTTDLTKFYDLLNAGFVAPLFNRYKTFDAKAFEFFEQSSHRMLADRIAMRRQEGFSRVMDSMSNVASNIKDCFKNGWNTLKAKFTGETNKMPETELTVENNFQMLTKSFDEMRTDSLKILSEINESIIEISKHRIQLGNVNTPEYSTTDSNLQPVNVVVNNEDDSRKEIVNLLKKMGEGVSHIVRNTSISDNGQRKENATLWTLDG